MHTPSHIECQALGQVEQTILTETSILRHKINILHDLDFPGNKKQLKNQMWGTGVTQ